MTGRAVRVVPHDPEWASAFEATRAALEGVFPVGAVIEHVGSTAVPGLPAKPILDVMVGLESLTEAEARVAELSALGFTYVPDYEDELPDRRYFRKPNEHPHTHHLHCVVRGGPFWLSHIAFRDRLRDDSELRDEYGRLKTELAERFGADRKGYLAAKAPFIERVLA